MQYLRSLLFYVTENNRSISQNFLDTSKKHSFTVFFFIFILCVCVWGGVCFVLFLFFRKKAKTLPSFTDSSLDWLNVNNLLDFSS